MFAWTDADGLIWMFYIDRNCYESSTVSLLALEREVCLQALCLARAGKKVIVLEQHYVPGGWCHSFLYWWPAVQSRVHYIGSVDEGQGADKLYKGLGITNDLVFFRMNQMDMNIAG